MHYKQSINQEYVLWGSIITSIYKTSFYLLEDKKLLPDSGTCLLTEMRAELHFAGFQIFAFIARVARNWPQSNDGQSQHFCPAASHIINKYQAH